ncbi:hypothetical protein LCGC14_2898530 [marine sediment metagenome]|uniref:Uncharacterized protein n=1 Tax=marine sediment metagenome TaxID=412755 RepID=A0A0F8XV52_9ZZZZ
MNHLFKVLMNLEVEAYKFKDPLIAFIYVLIQKQGSSIVYEAIDQAVAMIQAGSETKNVWLGGLAHFYAWALGEGSNPDLPEDSLPHQPLPGLPKLTVLDYSKNI